MMILTREREARGWSRADLAARAHLHPGDVGKFERGVLIPYQSQLLRLRDALSFEGEPAALLEECEGHVD
jgi:ribosome-binding protein aMBF1 (putative translation factor)